MLADKNALQLLQSGPYAGRTIVALTKNRLEHIAEEDLACHVAHHLEGLPMDFWGEIIAIRKHDHRPHRARRRTDSAGHGADSITNDFSIWALSFGFFEIRKEYNASFFHSEPSQRAFHSISVFQFGSHAVDDGMVAEVLTIFVDYVN